jgi:biopolymer transport protein ExbB/TolQ
VNLVETGKRIMVGTGAQAVLWLLIGLSIVSVAMIVERSWAFVRRRGDIEALRAKLLAALDVGGFDRALQAMTGSRHPAALVALRGLSLKRGASLPSPKEAEEAMDAEIIAQKGILEAGLGLLATLGANAPFVGLFGTVVGIVGAFDALGRGASAGLGGAAAAQGSLQVMGSIGEALVATAVGIGVAIPAVAAFNFFSRASKRILSGAEILQKELLAYLEGREIRPLVEMPAPSVGQSGITLSAMGPR